MLLYAMDWMFLGRGKDLRANLADILRVLLPWSVAQIFPVLRLRAALVGLLKCQPGQVLMVKMERGSVTDQKCVRKLSFVVSCEIRKKH